VNTLTPKKLKRLVTESLRNSLRLHADATLLYTHDSYPSAFQLAILALEELAKAKTLGHYYYSNETNGRPGRQRDEPFEQELLLALYSHTWKQFAFVGRDEFEYSPKW
jgi:AbiV family abortive infection protein